jgi:hypothetical protein
MVNKKVIIMHMSGFKNFIAGLNDESLEFRLHALKQLKDFAPKKIENGAIDNFLEIVFSQPVKFSSDFVIERLNYIERNRTVFGMKAVDQYELFLKELFDYSRELYSDSPSVLEKVCEMVRAYHVPGEGVSYLEKSVKGGHSGLIVGALFDPDISIEDMDIFESVIEGYSPKMKGRIASLFRAESITQEMIDRVVVEYTSDMDSLLIELIKKTPNFSISEEHLFRLLEKTPSKELVSLLRVDKISKDLIDKVINDYSNNIDPLLINLLSKMPDFLVSEERLIELIQKKASKDVLIPLIDRMGYLNSAVYKAASENCSAKTLQKIKSQSGFRYYLNMFINMFAPKKSVPELKPIDNTVNRTLVNRPAKLAEPAESNQTVMSNSKDNALSK